MAVSNWTEADTQAAQRIWADYQEQHDVAKLKGQAVGIEPTSGRVWFGESGLDIRRQMDAEGVALPFFCVRVGHDYYYRKKVIIR